MKVQSLIRHPQFGPAAVALAGTLAVLLTLDGSGELGTLPGPGITSDETIYVPQAKLYVWSLTRLGPAFFERAAIQEVFGRSHDHPPLGRWLLGWTHWLSDPRAADLNTFSVTRARPAPAIAYGVLIFLMGVVTSRLAGRGAGLIAALATLLMPRLFAHAHVAALDAFIALFYCAALCSFHRAMQQPRRLRRAALAGFMTGLALLTKMHALLLPVVLVPWALWFWGRRAVVPLLAWGLVALATFVLAWPWIWPWLWTSPAAHVNCCPDIQAPSSIARWLGQGPAAALKHLSDYLAGATQRTSIRVWYLGRVMPDRAVPFHYPWLMFLTTVPVGLHLLAALGLRRLGRRLWREPGWALLAAGMAVMLVLFSLPGVVVYDSERLFLMVFPLWAAFAGVGGMAAWDWLRQCLEKMVRQQVNEPASAPSRLPARLASTLLGLFLTAQGIGLVRLHPFQLSYYNVLVGGLAGADRLGLEATYWGDGVDRRLLAQLPPLLSTHLALSTQHSALAVPHCVLYAPSLHPLQARGLTLSSPLLRQAGIQLRGADRASVTANPSASRGCPLLVVYNRRAYLDDVRPLLRPENVLWQQSRQGVWLAAIYRLEEAASRSDDP